MRRRHTMKDLPIDRMAVAALSAKSATDSLGSASALSPGTTARSNGSSGAGQNDKWLLAGASLGSQASLPSQERDSDGYSLLLAGASLGSLPSNSSARGSVRGDSSLRSHGSPVGSARALLASTSLSSDKGSARGGASFTCGSGSSQVKSSRVDSIGGSFTCGSAGGDGSTPTPDLFDRPPSSVAGGRRPLRRSSTSPAFNRGPPSVTPSVERAAWTSKDKSE